MSRGRGWRDGTPLGLIGNIVLCPGMGQYLTYCIAMSWPDVATQTMRNKPENQSGSSAGAEGSLSGECCGEGSLLTPPDYGASFPCSAPCWPNVPCSDCGMDGPDELRSPSFPRIFWESSILETFERRGEYFRGDSSTGTLFPFLSLGKACSPLVSIPSPS